LRGPRGGMIMCRADLAKGIDKKIFPGIQGGPLMHIIAAKAVALKEAMSPDFKRYQGQVIANARVLGEELASKGYNLVSGGTDNHLLLVDLTNKEVTGKEAEDALVKAGITVNKNTVPFETRSPFVTSGIRIGTPAVTTRGMKEGEMRDIAGMIDEAIEARSDEGHLVSIKGRVRDLCEGFPFYRERATR
ncbi:MAG: serine hydroxymethyltransferase, partial [Thermodesulfobacteriota bacterium]